MNPPLPLMSLVHRKIGVVMSVVLLHLVVLWAFQSGMMRRAVEVFVPGEILSEFINPPAPPAPQRPRAVPPRPPQPARAADPEPPKPLVPLAVEPAMLLQAAAPPPPTPAPPAVEAVAMPAPATAPPPPPRLDLPSSDAAYLNNPRPAYPALSKRLGEQGRVVVRVLIGADGSAREAHIKSSSGYERLDQTALATVLKWRYVPGKRNGVAEDMWFEVPINFVLR